MLIAAILNAVIREKLLTPAFGDPVGRAISSLTLSVLIFLIVFFVIRWFPIRNTSGLWFLGIFWTALTITFEFSFGFFRGLSWEAMLEDYNLLKGRRWVLVLMTTLLSPLLARPGRAGFDKAEATKSFFAIQRGLTYIYRYVIR
jgi:hypothetical protein